MIRTAYWFTMFWLYQLVSLLFLAYYGILGKLGKKEHQKAFLYKISSRWARSMVRFSGSKVEVIGLENIPEGAVLYVSNHQSNFDIPVLMGYIPKAKGFVAKIELKKMPVVKNWMEAMECLFLDRSNLKQSLTVILDGIEKLKNGTTLVIFPEGTRNKGKEMLEFKKGSLKLATKAQVPVVPITIDGTFRMLEEKGRITKSKVRLIVHPAIDVTILSVEEKNNLAEKVFEIIQKPLKELA